MGLNKMLQQGLASAEGELKKAASQSADMTKENSSKGSSVISKESDVSIVNDSSTKNKTRAKKTLSDKLQQESTTKETKSTKKDTLKEDSTPVKKHDTQTKGKKRPGRPTNESLGRASRKQYTLTLKEEDYREFLEYAESEEISFAKFMQKAGKEYIRNHYLI